MEMAKIKRSIAKERKPKRVSNTSRKNLLDKQNYEKVKDLSKKELKARREVV